MEQDVCNLVFEYAYNDSDDYATFIKNVCNILMNTEGYKKYINNIYIDNYDKNIFELGESQSLFDTMKFDIYLYTEYIVYDASQMLGYQVINSKLDNNILFYYAILFNIFLKMEKSSLNEMIDNPNNNSVYYNLICKCLMTQNSLSLENCNKESCVEESFYAYEYDPIFRFINVMAYKKLFSIFNNSSGVSSIIKEFFEEYRKINLLIGYQDFYSHDEEEILMDSPSIYYFKLHNISDILNIQELLEEKKITLEDYLYEYFNVNERVLMGVTISNKEYELYSKGTILDTCVEKSNILC